jgi:peptidoglycan/xylan/chitin deacetylase (PgdA/CDA1 family)
LKAVILAYHRVAALSTDPQLLAVTPSRFDEQLAALQGAFDPMSLSDLVAAHKRGENPAGFVLTFDDGYNDNLHVALPILRRHELHATVFVTSSYVGASREFWWDELERIVLFPPTLPEKLRLRIAGSDLAWDLGNSAHSALLENRSWNLVDHGDPTARHALYRSLCSRFGRLIPKERESLLENLRRWAGIERRPRRSHRPLDEAELVELASDGLVDIGAHSAEHPVLAALPLAIQGDEIESSKRYLEHILGTDVTHFSYPFGRGRPPRQSYGRDTVKLVERAGYDSACALKPAIHLRSHRHELPRFIVQDWDGDELLRRIQLRLPAPLRVVTRHVVATR